MHRFTAGTVAVALHSRLLRLTHALQSHDSAFSPSSPLPLPRGRDSDLAARTRAYPLEEARAFVRSTPALAANATAKRIKMVRRARRGMKGMKGPFRRNMDRDGCASDAHSARHTARALRQDDDIRLCDIRDTRAG